MTAAEVTFTILGTAAGVTGSLLVGIILQWVRRSGEYQDRTSRLNAALAGVQVSVDHLGDSIGSLKKDTTARFDRVDSRFDRLPCAEWCVGTGRIGKRADT